MSTILVRIEAVFNSRPLCPVTNDSDDLHVLTPGHFLVGTSLSLRTVIPEQDVNAGALDNLHHWQLIQGPQAVFWKKWSQEIPTPEVHSEVDDYVVLSEEFLRAIDDVKKAFHDNSNDDENGVDSDSSDKQQISFLKRTCKRRKIADETAKSNTRKRKHDPNSTIDAKAKKARSMGEAGVGRNDIAFKAKTIGPGCTVCFI
ncbi:hypothetical protein TKK_0002862 [Trichogramma kaykai]|uniref:Uncharacterized protein n=1 Tax=Trichogramma kaykai TaxID=54128 RepID=A0ABD2XS41_9HYME